MLQADGTFSANGRLYPPSTADADSAIEIRRDFSDPVAESSKVESANDPAQGWRGNPVAGDASGWWSHSGRQTDADGLCRISGDGRAPDGGGTVRSHPPTNRTGP